MKKLSGEQSGNALLLPVIILVLLFLAAGSFAVWAYSGRQDYKNNVDTKVATAVSANTQKVQADDAKQYAETAKNPLKTYAGPDAYGSVKVAYPKTWSAYVNTTSTNSTPLDAYFHTDYVPAVELKQPYNLRIQVLATSYTQVLNSYNSLVKAGKLTVSPYSLPKVGNVPGSILTGQFVSSDNSPQGTLVLLPLRDKTLKVWTESPTYLADFNTYILQNLTFSP